MTKEELYADFLVKKYCAEAEFEAYEKVIDYTNRMVESCQRKKKEAEKVRDKGGLSKNAKLRLDRKMTMNISAENAYMTCCNSIIKIYIEKKNAFISRMDDISELVRNYNEENTDKL